MRIVKIYIPIWFYFNWRDGSVVLEKYTFTFQYGSTLISFVYPP